jgi:oligoendopeptidase F
MSNIITLAHEMGHAVHAHLASAKQTYINLRAPMVLAETASEFGKMFFIDKIIKEAPTDDIRKSILFNHLQRIFNVVFEVGSRTRFEEKLYKAVENGTYLSADKITELFWEARNLYFGDTVKWLPEQAYHWCWKPHYYMHDIRFYNYPYVFGELLVLALYNKFLEEGASFIPKYKAFLASGCSKSPAKNVKDLGVDLTSPEFWELGFTEIRRLLAEFKALI